MKLFLKIIFYVVVLIFAIYTVLWLKIYYQAHPKSTPFNVHATQKFNLNNNASLLINGVNSLPQRTANIIKADVILLKTFEYHDDFSGNALVDLLIKKAQSGALIFIQFDVKGNDNYLTDNLAIKLGKKNPLPIPFQRLMNAAPNQVFIYPTNAPIDFLTILYDKLGVSIPVDHEKYLMTWNSQSPNKPVRLVIGGMNIGDSYLLGGVKDTTGKFIILPQTHDYPWRDTDIELTGEVIKEIIHRFYQEASAQSKTPNLYMQKYLSLEMITGLEKLSSVISLMDAHASTAYAPQTTNAKDLVKANYFYKNIYENKIEQALIQYLKQVPSSQTVILVAPYFLLSSELQQAVLNAISRGVHFKVLSNNINSLNFGFAKVAYASRCRLRHLFSQVTNEYFRYYEYVGSSKVGFHNVHQKVWLLGNQENSVFAIGSSNLDAQSLRINSEDMLFMKNPDLQRKFQQMIENDLNEDNVHEITKSELLKEPMYEKFGQCWDDWLFHFIM